MSFLSHSRGTSALCPLRALMQPCGGLVFTPFFFCHLTLFSVGVYALLSNTISADMFYTNSGSFKMQTRRLEFDIDGQTSTLLY